MSTLKWEFQWIEATFQRSRCISPQDWHTTRGFYWLIVGFCCSCIKIELLKISRFEYFLANGRKNLGKEVFDMIFGEDFLEGLHMQMFEKVHDFLEDGLSLILKGNWIHISGDDFLVPLLFTNVCERILYHIFIKVINIILSLFQTISFK